MQDVSIRYKALQICYRRANSGGGEGRGLTTRSSGTERWRESRAGRSVRWRETGGGVGRGQDCISARSIHGNQQQNSNLQWVERGEVLAHPQRLVLVEPDELRNSRYKNSATSQSSESHSQVHYRRIFVQTPESPGGKKTDQGYEDVTNTSMSQRANSPICQHLNVRSLFGNKRKICCLRQNQSYQICDLVWFSAGVLVTYDNNSYLRALWRPEILLFQGEQRSGLVEPQRDSAGGVLIDQSLYAVNGVLISPLTPFSLF